MGRGEYTVEWLEKIVSNENEVLWTYILVGLLAIKSIS